MCLPVQTLAITSSRRGRNSRRLRLCDQPTEVLEQRRVLSADTLPVLMVIADQQDFYYQEYNDTRNSIEAAGLTVDVAATTTAPSTPHWNSGQGAGDGIVVPDLTLASVNEDDYSAIVFVGGWGSSMYQYAFPGDYSNNRYDGDAATKEIVNDLITEFDAAEKHLGFICHATTIAAWSRIDGVSLMNGKQVSVPYVGSPAVLYNGMLYGSGHLGQYEQAFDNGATPNMVSGQYGDPTTATDDVVVDGRLITAENWDSAAYFGQTIAEQVILAAAPAENSAPVASDSVMQVSENSTAGTWVGTVNASDPDVGQTLSYSIVGGNTNGAFAIDAASGVITVDNAATLDFEAYPVFQLQILVSDDAEAPLSDTATITVELLDVNETPPASVYAVGDDLIVKGTDADYLFYFWSGQTAEQVFVWMNGVAYGSWVLPESGRTIVYAGAGDDSVYATDAASSVSIFGQDGHDRITGGSASDLLDGGNGWDRVWGNQGDDLIRGGADRDFLFGREGNDIILGGDGDDYVEGNEGRDIVIGGMGSDYMKGGADQDLLIGGFTDLDDDELLLRSLNLMWNSQDSFAARVAALQSGSQPGTPLLAGSTVHDDNSADIMCSGEDADLFFIGFADNPYDDEDDLFAEM
jgi:putative intracellular protease/amidase